MPKRRSAWGSISQSRAGVWRLRYPLPPDQETGARRQGYETVHGTKADASKRLAELRLEHDRYAAAKPDMTVSELWENHYSKFIEKHLAPSTVEGYGSAYRAHIWPRFGNCELEKVRRGDVQEWLDGLSYGAAKKAFAVARALFSFAVDNELCNESPFAKRYRLPKKPTTSTKDAAQSVHTEEELREVLKAARGERWEAAFILSAFGGMRREEAFGVKWEDVDFCDGYAVIHIYMCVQPATGGVRIIDRTKTESSTRDVAIPAPYSDRLRELLFEYMGDVWVCDDGLSMPANPDLVSAAYKRWHIGKPYKYVPWKNLRNSYATMLHNRGVDLATVARLLGHSTPTLTFKHYDRPSAEQLAASVSVLSEP